jgi:hypothetical protein
MEARLHIIFYLQTTHNSYFKVLKIENKVLEIDNGVYYNCVKSQYKLLHILSYTKNYKF